MRHEAKIIDFYIVFQRFSRYRLSGFRRPRTAQEDPKIAPRRTKRPPRRPQDGPRGPKDGPKGGTRTDISSPPPLEAPGTPQEDPKRPQEGPKRPPRGPKRLPRAPKRVSKTFSKRPQNCLQEAPERLLTRSQHTYKRPQTHNPGTVAERHLRTG